MLPSHFQAVDWKTRIGVDFGRSAGIASRKEYGIVFA